MNDDLFVVIGAIVVSLFGIPVALTAVFLGPGISSMGSRGTLGIGLVAMAPGVLMASTALWLAARSDPGTDRRR